MKLGDYTTEFIGGYHNLRILSQSSHDQLISFGYWLLCPPRHVVSSQTRRLGCKFQSWERYQRMTWSPTSGIQFTVSSIWESKRSKNGSLNSHLLLNIENFGGCQPHQNHTNIYIIYIYIYTYVYIYIYICIYIYNFDQTHHMYQIRKVSNDPPKL